MHVPKLWIAKQVMHSSCMHGYERMTRKQNPSLPFPSLPFPSLPFPSLPFPSLPFPSLPFPSLPFPSLPFPSLPQVKRFNNVKEANEEALQIANYADYVSFIVLLKEWKLSLLITRYGICIVTLSDLCYSCCTRLAFVLELFKSPRGQTETS